MNTILDPAYVQMQERKKLQSVLSGGAHFLRLKENSKTPKGKYATGSRNRLKNVPKDGNFGIIPQNDVFILDLDCHQKEASNIPNQVAFFSKLFGVDLHQTFSVITPSGGRHYYLRFPNNVFNLARKFRLPKASLRQFQDEFSTALDSDLNIVSPENEDKVITDHGVEIDADIRTGLINGYAVAPGSVVDGVAYTILNDTENILEIPEIALHRLHAVVMAQDENKREKRRETARLKSLEYSQFTKEDLAVDETQELIDTPSIQAIASLRKKLATRKSENPNLRFHAQRAFVKSALHCCYSDYAIAVACSELDIDLDTYAGGKIPFKLLYKDITRISPIEKFHGSYCQKGRLIRQAKRDEIRHEQYVTDAIRDAGNGNTEPSFDLESYLSNLKQRVANSDLAQKNRKNRVIDPRVVDVEKIVTKLLGEDHALLRTACSGHVFHHRAKQERRVSNEVRNAMKIVDYYIQPLLNVGAKFVMLAMNNVTQKLDITESQATQALRLLRKHEIIQVERKQRHGVPALYAVNEAYTSLPLTRALRRAWGRSGELLEGQLTQATGVTGKPLVEEKKLQHLPIYFDRFSNSFREVFSNKHVPSDLDKTGFSRVEQIVALRISPLIDSELMEKKLATQYQEEKENKPKRVFKSSVLPGIAGAKMCATLLALDKLEEIQNPKKFQQSALNNFSRTPRFNSGAAKHYLKEERAILGFTIVDDLVIVEDTGEIVTEDTILLSTMAEEEKTDDFEVAVEVSSSPFVSNDFEVDTSTPFVSNESAESILQDILGNLAHYGYSHRKSNSRNANKAPPSAVLRT